MNDIDSLIDIILSDEKLMNSKSFGSVYKDTPIIRPASRMETAVSHKIAEMRKIGSASSEIGFMSDARCFKYQAEFMADHEDDHEYNGDFVCYYPTYRSMNDRQLRGYFTWRTRIRRGEITEAPLSFAFVYIYELLNGIGVSSPEDGYRKIAKFGVDYGAVDGHVVRYVKMWLKDYVIYHNMDRSLLDDVDIVRAADVFTDIQQQSDDDIFSAAEMLSPYSVSRSKFFNEHHDEAQKVTCNVLKALDGYYRSHGKKTFPEKLFGLMAQFPIELFSSAVFYDDKKYKDYSYVLGSSVIYHCRYGRWSIEKFSGLNGKSHELGAIMKAIDCEMRRIVGYGSQLKPEKTTKLLIRLIEAETSAVLAEKERSKRPVIEIDVSKLGGIRRAADITRDKLIVDEDGYAEEENTVTEEVRAEEKTNDDSMHDNSPLDDNEHEFVRRLLYGGDWAAFIRENKLMLSVIADSVNEKLFDIFGDTVIGFSGDDPAVIEDYADELKGMIT